ncbi:hypothetical protein OH76DRAFT_1412918 [Lentinus brumalis]|uniref:Uncharacterized protein n=1 Tax=Lentinus brumalis TaxID=2498619 RepID=A0A371CJS3_9APHY|nr:hypothetical protein OH76DRAFT_1412918 [Polyporus brumalis]
MSGPDRNTSHGAQGRLSTASQPYPSPNISRSHSLARDFAISSGSQATLNHAREPETPTRPPAGQFMSPQAVPGSVPGYGSGYHATTSHGIESGQHLSEPGYVPHSVSSAPQYGIQLPGWSERQPGPPTPSEANPIHLDALARLATHLGLEGEQRNQLYHFARLDEAQQRAHLYAYLLKEASSSSLLGSQLGALFCRLNEMEKLIGKRWELGRAHKLTLKALVKHYVASPQVNYTKLLSPIEKYIKSHHEKLDMAAYLSNQVVKNEVTPFLTKEINNAKNQFRKMIFRSVHPKTLASLAQLEETVLNKWHGKPKPTALTQKWSAHLALLRDVARPLVDLPTVKGGDSGFWSGITKAYDTLYKEHGKDRKAVAWMQWEQSIIATDRQTYPSGIGEVYIDPSEDEDDGAQEEGEDDFPEFETPATQAGAD